MAKKEKAPKPPKEKKVRKAKGAADDAAAKTGKGKVKIIVLSAAGVVLFGVIAFSAYMLMESRKGAADAAESGETAAVVESAEAEDEAGANIFIRLKDKVTGLFSKNGEPKPKKEKYLVGFSPGDAKMIYNVEEKDGDPYFEVMVNSARELSADEKSAFGLTRERGRLAQVELDVRLMDTTLDWNLYNRRIADPKGNWLDEILWFSDETLLFTGDSDSQTLIVKLPEDAEAKDPKIELSIFTSTWNQKKKADGKCEITVGPAPRPAAQANRPGANAAPKELSTEYGRWDGNTYTSARLDMRITLPDDWNPQLGAIPKGGADRSVEGNAVRDDGRATLQLSVDKLVGNLSESDQIDFFKDLLAKAVGDYSVSEPYRQTIAGKEYLGMTYTRDDLAYQIYFLRNGDDLVEVALHFPASEKELASQFLSSMKPVN